MPLHPATFSLLGALVVGKPYAIASFVTSVTPQQDQGVEAVPVPAPTLAKPNVDKS